MIEILNILVCLCGAIYLLARVKSGAGSLDFDIPDEFFRNILQSYSDSMQSAPRDVLYLLAFECLVLVLSVVYNRFLKERWPFVKKVRKLAVGLRFAVDCLLLIPMMFYVVVCKLPMLPMKYGSKPVRFIDEQKVIHRLVSTPEGVHWEPEIIHQK